MEHGASVTADSAEWHLAPQRHRPAGETPVRFKAIVSAGQSARPRSQSLPRGEVIVTAIVRLVGARSGGMGVRVCRALPVLDFASPQLIRPTYRRAGLSTRMRERPMRGPTGHPALVRVSTSGGPPRDPFLVMELVRANGCGVLPESRVPGPPFIQCCCPSRTGSACP